MNPKQIRNPARALSAIMLAAAIMFQSPAQFAAAEPAAAEASAGIARGRARDIILSAAGKYRDGLKPTDVMSGYPGGSLNEAQQATRLEALVMIARAFGKLPAPNADFFRVSLEPSYSGVPSWASPYIDMLAKARVMYVADDVDEGGEDEDASNNAGKALTLNGSEPMPASELGYVLQNIYALYGTRREDDFYATVNRGWLAESAIPDGKIMDSNFDRLSSLTEKRVEGIFDEVVSGEAGQGDKTARAIRDFYQAALDLGAQAAAGAAPIKPYLDKILAAKDKKGLEDALILVSKELAVNVFFDLEIRPDEYDKTKYSVYLTVPPLVGFAPEPDSDDTKNLLKRAEGFFTLCGYGGGPAYAESILKTKADGAEISGKYDVHIDEAASGESESDVNLMFFTKFAPKTEKEIAEMFPDVDFGRYLAACGLKTEPVWYSAYEGSALKVWADYYKQADINALKIFAAYTLIDYCGACFGADFQKLYNDYEEGDNERKTLSTTKYMAGPYVENLFVDRYFSAESKKDVEAMAKTFIGNYRGRIKNIGWMSAATKEMAIKKLDNMVVKVGYPDNLFDPMAAANIRSTKDGGSHFENLAAIRLADRANMSQKQGKPVDRAEWRDTVTEVNAFYRPDGNEILLPAGILQPPFYTPGAKQEQNMAGIGWVIGHEITHAFDNAGSKFDEFGNEANWWTEEDYAKFRGLCKEVINYYDGYEIAPGILTDGESTLGENIADLGGISCALQAVAALPGPDYELFFTSAAKLWICTMERETLHMQVGRDPHSPSKARANRVLATFQEFYDTFGVKEGDGMYVPPGQRVKVW